MKSKKIVFFGNERIATGLDSNAVILKALLEAGYEITATVISAEPPLSRNSRPMAVKEIANHHNIVVYTPNKISDIYDELKNQSSYIGILVAYGQIVPTKIIDLFPAGIINIHPSLLPLHRGPTPIESVILAGEQQTGVSIMQLGQKMDSGPVYAQSEIQLKGNESKKELADKLLDIGRAMLVELLPDIIDGSLQAIRQDDSRATYDKLIKKSDGQIDWNKPAHQLHREIRAYSEWPKSSTKLGQIQVVITKAQTIDKQLGIGEMMIKNKRIIVGSSKKSLEIIELKPAGKQHMSAESFIAGYLDRLG